VLENRGLMKVFVPNMNEVTREWRRLHNEELYDLYSSPNSVRLIKARKMRWAAHVARMGRGEVHTGLWWGNLTEINHLEDLGVDGKIILKWIFETWEGAWIELIWLRIGRSSRLLWKR
jgi:hypothetical protein